MKRSTLTAAVCGVLLGFGVSLAMAQPIDPSTFRNLRVTGTERVGTLDAGNTLINGQLQVLGPVVGSSTVSGTTITATNHFTVNSIGGLYTSGLAGLAGVGANGWAYQGGVADSAGNAEHVFFNSTAMTPGMDRYIAVFENDNGSTHRARIFTNGAYQTLAAVGTAASGTGVTASYSGASPYWLHKAVVTSAAMTAAATTDISIVVATPANSAIRRIKADVVTKFIGGALTAVTLTCGNAAGGNQYLLSGDIFTNAIVLGDTNAEIGLNLIPGNAAFADFGTAAAGTNGALLVTCRFTCTTANCNAATQGTVNFYVEGVTYF